MSKRARILLYSRDTFGGGHLRRRLSVATELASCIPNMSYCWKENGAWGNQLIFERTL